MAAASSSGGTQLGCKLALTASFRHVSAHSVCCGTRGDVAFMSAHTENLASVANGNMDGTSEWFMGKDCMARGAKFSHPCRPDRAPMKEYLVLRMHLWASENIACKN
jgi:hypothetical protein